MENVGCPGSYYTIIIDLLFSWIEYLMSIRENQNMNLSQRNSGQDCASE